MSVLLSDEQIKEYVCRTCCEKQDCECKCNEFQDTELILKEQCKAVIDWLEEPCTEHKANNPFDSDIHYLSHIGYSCLHKRDCLECMAELKKEIEGLHNAQSNSNSHE
jgi:hypothetical protein